MIIIGLVGQIGSGKGEVAKYLISQYGFVDYSLAHIVHEECKKKYPNETVTRELLQNVGDELRSEYGLQILAERTYKKALQSGQERVIVDGMRNDGELLFLKKQPSFVSIAIIADQKTRFERVLSRGKKWDPKDWKTFLKVDERDFNDTKNPNGQQVGKCIKLADYKIKNDRDLF